MDELRDARYISLTTYKRDGTPVATPVWFAPSDDRYVFTSGPETWKARRLRRDPRVQVQVCDGRGRVQAGTAVYTGTGTVKDDAASVAAAEAAIHAKYGWQFLVAQALVWLQRTFRVARPQGGAAIELSLQPAD
jgi:uncharacterized protein